MRGRSWSAVLLSAFLAAAGLASAEVKPHALFSDHAVMPRDCELPVWGTASDGEKVEVSFAGQTVTGTASAGKWVVRLKPLAASPTPSKMIIRGPRNEVVIQDLLVGDVWLCSGQSNMEWPLAKSTRGRQVAAGIKAPNIRLFQVEKRMSATPVSEAGGNWTACDPQHAMRFSAVAYYFGRDLNQAMQVPIGLIGSHVSATAAELWTSRSALDAHPKLKFLHERHQRIVQQYDPARAKADYEAAMEKYRTVAEKARAAGRKPPRAPGMAGNPKDRGPSCLYNGMIAPLQPFPIRGVIWYQGESNRANPPLYASLFPALIADWRKAWNRSDLPFLFVQLAPFNAVPPELREIQTQVWKSTPHTGMAVITDFGSAGNIHPPDKEPVGKRLALAARAIAYGERIVWSGPVFTKADFRQDRVILRFTSVAKGLRAQGNSGVLKGFSLAGADGKWVPAQAVIRGADTLEIISPEVSQPKAVRYGWDKVPDVNLFNSEGLPAVPFRTDNQPVIP